MGLRAVAPRLCQASFQRGRGNGGVEQVGAHHGGCRVVWLDHQRGRGAERGQLGLQRFTLGEVPNGVYSSVWSSTSAPGAFSFTDSIPCRADCLRS